LLSASVRPIQVWVEDGRFRAWKTPGSPGSAFEMLVTRQHASDGNLRKHEVLPVEDDPPIQHAVLERTRGDLKPDTQLRVTADGYETSILVGETRTDMLATDLAMPCLGGFHLIKTLARKASNQPIQLVVLTSLNLDEGVGAGRIAEWRHAAA
jgi:CheY-like chemotaxis protein